MPLMISGTAKCEMWAKIVTKMSQKKQDNLENI